MIFDYLGISLRYKDITTLLLDPISTTRAVPGRHCQGTFQSMTW